MVSGATKQRKGAGRQVVDAHEGVSFAQTEKWARRGILFVQLADVSEIPFFFQAEDGIRDYKVTGVQTCALPISMPTQDGLGPDDGYGAKDARAATIEPNEQSTIGPTQMRSAWRSLLQDIEL